MTDPGLDTPRNERIERIPHDRDVDWWVNEMEGELGKSGTLQSVISILERGGPGSAGGSSPDYMTERHREAVRRCQRIEAYWIKVPTAHRRTLRCYYEQRQLPRGVREELGQLAALALADATNTHLAEACSKLHGNPTSWRESEPGRIALQVVTAAVARTRAAALEAHKALADARGSDAKEWAHA